MEVKRNFMIITKKDEFFGLAGILKEIAHLICTLFHKTPKYGSV